MIPAVIIAVLLIAFIALVVLSREALNYQKSYETGVKHEKSGNVNGAIEHFEHALKLFPNHVQSMLHLAVLYSRTDRMSEAVDMYERLLDLNDIENTENMVKIHSRLAALYESRGLHERAYLERLKILEFEDHDETRLCIARFLAGSEDYDGALNQLKILMKSDYKRAQVLFLRGLCHASRGWLNEAVEDFEACLEVASDSVLAPFYLGYIYKDKRSVKAVEFFDDVALRAEDEDLSREASLLSGICCIEHGFYDKATRVLKARLKREREAGYEPGLEAGSVHMEDFQAGEHADAGDESGYHPDIQDLHYNLGWACLLNGDSDSAFQEWSYIADNHSFPNISQMLRQPENIDFEEQEIEWRRYSSNKNFKSAAEFLDYNVNWNLNKLNNSFLDWKEEFNQKKRERGPGEDVKFSSALAFSRAPSDVFRVTARKIVRGLHYNIKRETRAREGVDFFCYHRKDEQSLVLIAFRTWTEPTGVENIEEIRKNMQQNSCARSVLITCGEYREKAREKATENGMKVINQRQLTHMLKKI